ncbi:MAG: hypothetical protein ABIT09_12880 [Croceibacterium sp.]
MAHRRCLAGFVALLVVTGCAKPGGRVFRFAEAAEIPVAVTERDQLAALLAGYAQRNGLYFRDTSPRAQRTTNGRQTLALAMERTLTTGRPWAEVAVSAIGNGPALITFIDPPLAGVAEDSQAARAKLLAELTARWPAMLPVPVLPDGAIPRQEDLRHTPQGLKIDPASAAQYHLPADSPLVAR